MHDQLIASLRRRLAGWLTLKHSLALLTLFAFVWGTVVLAGRVSLRSTPEWMVWGLAAAPLCIAIAIWRALGQVPAKSALRAYVDRASSCGGMLMASEEQPLGPWAQRLRDPAELQVQWRGTKAWSMFLAGLVFLGVSFWFPQRLASWAEEGLEIGNDVLKEEKLIDKQRAEFLADALKQIQDKAEGRNPTKTLEALDHLRDQIAKTAQKAAESAVKKAEEFGRAEGLADAIRQNEGALADTVKAEALAELAGLVQKADAETGLLDQHIDPELLKQLRDAKLSPEEMKKLTEALKECKGNLAKSLGKLHKAKLIDADTLKRCMEAGKCDCAGALKERGGKIPVRDIVAQCERGGKGGLTEGPGHSPLTWTDGTSEDGAKFKEEVLPPSDLAQLKNSLVMGVNRADPKKDAAASKSGTLRSSTAGGGAANAATLLPQHRATVERFFDRKKE